MAITAIRTVILYIGITAAMRMMGKRQLGEMQPAELVVALMIADLAVIPMQESGLPLLQGLVPIAILVALELVLSTMMLKLPAFGKLVSGNPVVIIQDGKLLPRALKTLRMSVSDLSETLRQQSIFDIRDVQYAITETNGQISVYLKKEKQPANVEDVMKQSPPDTGAPILIVSDGQPIQWALELCGLDELWLSRMLDEESCRLDDVFLMTADKTGDYYLLRRGESA